MSDITRILQSIDAGDPQAADQLLPLVYEELRRLATAKMAQEAAGHTLQGTALVHEAYLRLVDRESQQKWSSSRHFFTAAAESMRRILIESARRKQRIKRGGDRVKVELDDDHLAIETRPDEVLAVDEALDRLASEEPIAAEIVQLRYFAGFSVEEAADILELSRATAYRHWAYARAWLRCELRDMNSVSDGESEES